MKKRQAPVSFPLIAPLPVQEEAIRLWCTSDATVKRWANEHGVTFKAPDYAYSKPTKRPATFTAEAVAGVRVKALVERYGHSDKVIRRWLREVGIESRYRKPEKAAPAVSVAPPEPVHVLRRAPRTVKQDTVKVLAPRSPLPAEPCWRCGARGFCGHDFRVAA